MAQIEDGKIVTVRAAQPGSYMFNIQSFLCLTQLDMTRVNIKYFESPVFESCGHKWKMVVYPYGDERQGVNDHISVYLVSCDADNVGYDVAFKIFVYNNIHDNFLTIQDSESETRRFHKLKKEWGFARLISLEKFKEPKNGYIVNDSCVFGVEIIVIPTRVQVGKFSVIKEPKPPVFTWKLKKFSTLGDPGLYSQVFKTHDHQWKLTVYPNGDSRAKGTHLSLYLQQQPYVGFFPNPVSEVNVKVVLRITSLKVDKHCTKTFAQRYYQAQSWGYSEFILLETLKNKSNGYISDDTVTFEAEVNCISKTHP